MIALAMAIPLGWSSQTDLLPVPASLTPGEGAMSLDSGFTVSTAACRDERVGRSATRLLRRVEAQTGLRLFPGRSPGLDIACGPAPHKVQQAIEDESYTLQVTPQGARLTAPTPYGALRGVETFLQLIEPAADGWQVRAVKIEDRPRFPWRGLLIDACRHFMPVPAIERNLDAMAAVKLNVLHWHLSEDQGFRVESRRFPRLHERGSDGQFYTQQQIREVIAYARDRGIRVVPEFDMPGHTTAWFVGHPELAAGPGPYQIERGWGVFDPVMDPTREEVYRFLGRFLGEMTRLFPDPYFHIGGDEVNGVQWNQNPKIAAFKQAHGMASNEELQAYFNTRLLAILTRHGKKMIGWDEILQPSLPKNIVVQSWRGPEALAQASRDGFSGILSWGYYLDHQLSAAKHYAVDPLGKEGAALKPEEQARILGGEACMWNEYVTPEMLDGRIWPRAAAIAERFWSPREVTDVADMYRRLESASQRLEYLGLTHRSVGRVMLQRLANGQPIDALLEFAALVEPVKGYSRGGRPYNSLVPLNRMVDAVRSESEEGRRFSELVARFQADPENLEGRRQIETSLRRWSELKSSLAPVLSAAPQLAEIQPLVADLSAASDLALRALAGPLEINPEEAALIERLNQPQAELQLAVADALKKIINPTSHR